MVRNRKQNHMKKDKQDICYVIQDASGKEVSRLFDTIEEAKGFFRKAGRTDWYLIRYSGFHSVKADRI